MIFVRPKQPQTHPRRGLFAWLKGNKSEPKTAQIRKAPNDLNADGFTLIMPQKQGVGTSLKRPNNRPIRIRTYKVLFAVGTIAALLGSTQTHPVRAASGYDDDYQTTNVVQVVGGVHSCSAEVITDSWKDKINDAGNWEPFVGVPADEAASFGTALTSGSYIVSAVSYDLTSGNFGTEVIVAWSEASSANITFDGSGHVIYNYDGVHNLHAVKIKSHKDYAGSGTCDSKVVSLTTPTSVQVSSDPDSLGTGETEYRNYVVGGNATVTYPTGYAGANIKRDSTDGKTYPQFTLFVTGPSLTAYYNANLPEHDTRLGVDTLTWHLQSKNEAEGWHDETTITSGLDEKFIWALNLGDTYRISLTYNVVSPNTPFDGLVLGTRTLEFEAGEGAFVADSASLVGCNSDGVCDITPEALPDCDLTDIPCQLAKLIGAIKGALTWLFVPNADSLKYAVTGNVKTISEKLGFLSYPFVFLGDLFSAFTTSTSTWCTDSSCTKSFGNFFGQPASINLLAVKDLNSSLWNYILLAIRGVTVLALILGIRKKFMEVVAK